MEEILSTSLFHLFTTNVSRRRHGCPACLGCGDWALATGFVEKSALAHGSDKGIYDCRYVFSFFF